MLSSRVLLGLFLAIAASGAQATAGSTAAGAPAVVPVRIKNSKSVGMMMPLVAPLFISDENTSSILTLVHDLPEPVSVDISINDDSGRLIATFSKTIPPHGQIAVSMNEHYRGCILPDRLSGLYR